MSHFTPDEIAYLNGQQLGRLATADEHGQPHVVPVSFSYNPDLDTIDISGHNFSKSKKWRDAGKNDRVAFVVDDVLPPWSPRGVEVRGRAERLEQGGQGVNADFEAALLRIHPTRIVGWGLDTDAYRPNGRTVGDQ